RPEGGGEIDVAVRDNGGAARGPGRDQPVVAENLAVRWAAAELPDELARVLLEAVEITVVGREVEAIRPGDRGEADRGIDEVLPFFLAGARVESPDAIVPGAVE